MYTNSRIGNMRIDLQTIVLNEWVLFYEIAVSDVRWATKTRILLCVTSYYSSYIYVCVCVCV